MLLLILWLQTPVGGGEAWVSRSPCMNQAQHQLLVGSFLELQKAWNYSSPPKKQITRLDFPLSQAQTNPFPDYYGISNFVDHNEAFPNKVLDYFGGARTYDTNDGYNHQGTDIFTWPFPWLQMDQNWAHVIAAAPGTIMAKYDGHFSGNCTFDPPDSFWNAVYVRHADGSVAWYGHLKEGSLTEKEVGETVNTGEYLGVVGSSGISTGPHLHFELYDENGNLVDPWEGPSNDWNNGWWQDQLPYYDSTLLALETHNQAPQFGCFGEEFPHRSSFFQPGDTLIVATYYRDQRSGQNSAFEIRGPSGASFKKWNHASTVEHYSGSYWYWTFTLPHNAEPGDWEVEASFEGKTLRQGFYVAGDVDYSQMRWLPHITSRSGGFYSSINVTNLGQEIETVVLHPFSQEGEPLKPESIELKPNQFIQAEVLQLLGDQVSHVGIEGPAALKVGAAFRKALPAPGGTAHTRSVDTAAQSFRLFQGEWDTLFDGMAMVNVGSELAIVTGKQLNSEGKEIFSVSLGQIDPFEKMLSVFSTVFPDDPSSQIVIETDQPCVLVFLRGSISGTSYLYQTVPITP